MSLYREVGNSRRAVAIAALISLIIGAGAGFGIGRASAPDPDLSEQIDELGTELEPALNALDLIEVEYPQAAGAGAEGTAEPEAAAASESLATTAIDTLEANSEQLQALDPEAYDAALEATEEVAAAIGAGDPPAEVVRAAEGAADAIRSAAGIAASEGFDPDAP